ncbi:MAG: histidine kinase, partial [Okeania sp. SIO2H7]|nr:histidine kinase [Okeania sp. SIO2H7]
AQTLPYQKFHQAWHRDNTPTTQMQEKQLANICTQLQHLPLWCIDADILGNETTEEAIAQTLCELISTAIDPDTDYPEVNNAAQLRKYLRFLAKQQKPLVILIHNCEPEEAIALFCRKLTNIARIIWITDAPVEPPIKAFSPGHPNLVEAVESWLEELMLWNGE